MESNGFYAASYRGRALIGGFIWRSEVVECLRSYELTREEEAAVWKKIGTVSTEKRIMLRMES